ncbi:MAG: transporter substrate-binding domain-containing protein [Rubrivivax sp.]|nr:transporter substrate-binding domain-containing protein [Rubrivivax sp.]
MSLLPREGLVRPPLRSQARVFAAAGAAVAGLAAVVAALVWMVAGDSSLRDVRARGELRIGYAVEAPYAMLKADRTPGGESLEVARAVARHLGLRPVWIVTDFDRLLPELEAGRFDIIAAGLFVTAARSERVRFTRPQLRVRPGWLVRAGQPPALGTYASVRPSPSLRVAVVASSVEEAQFAGRATPPASLVVVPDVRTGAAIVGTGGADALALSLPAVSAMARAAQGRLVALPALVASGAGAAPAAQQAQQTHEDHVAMAVRKDAAALAAAIDEALAGYLGSAAHLAMLGELGLGEDDLPRARDGGRP